MLQDVLHCLVRGWRIGGPANLFQQAAGCAPLSGYSLVCRGSCECFSTCCRMCSTVWLDKSLACRGSCESSSCCWMCSALWFSRPREHRYEGAHSLWSPCVATMWLFLSLIVLYMNYWTMHAALSCLPSSVWGPSGNSLFNSQLAPDNKHPVGQSISRQRQEAFVCFHVAFHPQRL